VLDRENSNCRFPVSLLTTQLKNCLFHESRFDSCVGLNYLEKVVLIMFHDVDFFNFDTADFPFSVSSERSGDGFYVRAAGGVSATPNTAAVISSAVSIGGSPHTMANASAKTAGFASNSAFGIGYSSSRAFARSF
jgi:hypothetical protein